MSKLKFYSHSKQVPNESLGSNFSSSLGNSKPKTHRKRGKLGTKASVGMIPEEKKELHRKQPSLNSMN
jgi:hypothetical protein